MPSILPRPQVEIESGRLYSREFDDCYFQQGLAVEQVIHTFIQATQLIKRWDECLARQQEIFIIGETGFGSGLNFVVTLYYWHQWCTHNPLSLLQLHFISVEFAPLDVADLQKIYQTFPDLAAFAAQLIQNWPPTWQGCHARRLPNRVFLSLLFGECTQMLGQYQFYADIWFLDGFTPSRNQSMWRIELFQLIAKRSKNGTRLATFTAASLVRKGLTSVGFQVRKQAGFHKREMIIAVFSAQSVAVATPSVGRKKYAIIGAGYAGLHIAHALYQNGFDLDLYDQNQAPMQGASVNHSHLLYLNPRMVSNQFNHFFEQAYSYAIAAYQQYQGVHPCGVLHLQSHQRKQWTTAQIQAAWPAAWLQQVNASQASAIAGIALASPCLWMPQGFAIEPAQFAQSLLQQCVGLHQLFGRKILDIQPSQASSPWLLTSKLGREPAQEKIYDGVVIAAGAGSIGLLKNLGNRCIGSDVTKPSHWRYPLRPIAGQSSVLPEKSVSLSPLKVALCGQSYAIPPINGAISFGSTFYKDQLSAGLNQADHLANLTGLIELLGLTHTPQHLLSSIDLGFAATRVQTTDYAPMIGAIFPEKAPHLYLMTGFGAKGSMVTPFAAGMLRQLICGHSVLAEASMVNLVDPERFAQRLMPI